MHTLQGAFMSSLDNQYVTWIMYIIFIHFKADICSGISWIIFVLEGKNLPVCIFWSLRSKTFLLSVRKWEPFRCPAAMLEPCILPSKPRPCPWLCCLIISRAELVQISSFQHGELAEGDIMAWFQMEPCVGWIIFTTIQALLESPVDWQYWTQRRIWWKERRELSAIHSRGLKLSKTCCFLHLWSCLL